MRIPYHQARKLHILCLFHCNQRRPILIRDCLDIFAYTQIFSVQLLSSMHSAIWALFCIFRYDINIRGSYIIAQTTVESDQAEKRRNADAEIKLGKNPAICFPCDYWNFSHNSTPEESGLVRTSRNWRLVNGFCQLNNSNK